MVLKSEVIYKYMIDEMSKFKNRGDTEKFLNSLEERERDILFQWLSRWRQNDMYNKIMKSPDEWNQKTIPISQIRVGRINATLNPLLERCKFRLDRIAEDKDIKSHREFKHQGNMTSSDLIAKKENSTYKIIDGIHRAIRLVLDGQKQIDLIYY